MNQAGLLPRPLVLSRSRTNSRACASILDSACGCQQLPRLGFQKIQPGNRSSYKDFSLTIDPDAVKKNIGPKTKAVMSVDVNGRGCFYEELEPWATGFSSVSAVVPGKDTVFTCTDDGRIGRREAASGREQGSASGNRDIVLAARSHGYGSQQTATGRPTLILWYPRCPTSAHGGYLSNHCTTARPREGRCLPADALESISRRG